MRDGEPINQWPFDMWLQMAVRHFGINPQEFWQMSVRDWLALLAAQNSASLNRADLNSLMSHYPDKPSKERTS